MSPGVLRADCIPAGPADHELRVSRLAARERIETLRDDELVLLVCGEHVTLDLLLRVRAGDLRLGAGVPVVVDVGDVHCTLARQTRREHVRVVADRGVAGPPEALGRRGTTIRWAVARPFHLRHQDLECREFSLRNSTEEETVIHDKSPAGWRVASLRRVRWLSS